MLLGDALEQLKTLEDESAYACIIASMAVNKPKELFTGLPLCDLLNLKEAVNNSNFFE